MGSPAIPEPDITSTPPAAAVPPRTSMDQAAMSEYLRNRMTGALPGPNAAPPPAQPVVAPPPPAAAPPPPPVPPVAAQPPVAAPPPVEPPPPGEPPSIEDFDFDRRDEAPAQEAAPGTAPPTPDPDLDELKALLGDVDVKTLNNRGRAIYESFKARRALTASPDEGGIGFLPTTEDIKRYYTNSTQWEAAELEFQNNPESWLVNHLGPDEQGQLPPGAIEVLDSFLPTLQNIDPRLFNRAVEPLISTTLQNLQREVAAIPEGQGKDSDPFGVDDRTRLQDAIDILTAKWGRTPGAARTNGQPAARPGARPAALPPVNPNDPLAQERAELAQQQERLNHEYKLLKDAALGSLENHVRQAVTSELDKDIVFLAKSHGVTPDKFPSEWMYNQWVEGFRGAVASAVTGNPKLRKPPLNPTGWENFQISMSRASAVATSRNRDRQYDPSTDPNAKQAISTYRLIAIPVIRSLAHQYLKDAGVSIVNGNAARTATQAPSAEAQAHREPTTAGAPVAHSVVPPPHQFERKPGEDPVDSMSRFLKERMSQAAVPGR